jgi:hypothetical protein
MPAKSNKLAWLFIHFASTQQAQRIDALIEALESLANERMLSSLSIFVISCFKEWFYSQSKINYVFIIVQLYLIQTRATNFKKDCFIIFIKQLTKIKARILHMQTQEFINSEFLTEIFVFHLKSEICNKKFEQDFIFRNLNCPPKYQQQFNAYKR